MATVDVQGTKFSFSLLPLKAFSSGHYARARIEIQNEYVQYGYTVEKLLREDMEEWIFCMFRLLAGAYGREYSLNFERTGIRVDLCAHTEDGREVSREERRKQDCLMLIHLVLKSKEGGFLGGAQTFIFHRQDIEKFASAIREEFYQIFEKYARGKGKYLFAGVSPYEYKGCNYWYYDPSGKAKAGDYVWIRMGRHNREQVGFVDSVRYFSEDTAPYSPQSMKQVLGLVLDKDWNKDNKDKDNKI